jgi:hypothetical protein
MYKLQKAFLASFILLFVGSSCLLGRSATCTNPEPTITSITPATNTVLAGNALSIKWGFASVSPACMPDKYITNISIAASVQGSYPIIMYFADVEGPLQVTPTSTDIDLNLTSSATGAEIDFNLIVNYISSVDGSTPTYTNYRYPFTYYYRQQPLNITLLLWILVGIAAGVMVVYYYYATQKKFKRQAYLDKMLELCGRPKYQKNPTEQQKINADTPDCLKYYEEIGDIP